MPHIIKERHLEDICAQCKKPHGNSITLQRNYHRLYEIIICQNCGYEIIRVVQQKEFNDRFKM
jgi:RNase P subunit RPR2